MSRCFLLIPLVILISACSSAEPELAFASMRLVYMREGGAVVERLSFFAMASDADGVENLSELRLHHELEGLTWTMTEDDWVEATQDEKTWIGSRAIAMPDGDPLPRGLYRAVLVNKAIPISVSPQRVVVCIEFAFRAYHTIAQ